MTRSGARCDKVWYKVLLGLVQDVAGSGTRCDHSLVQGVKRSGIRCDKAWYKVYQGLVQGMTGSGTRCARTGTRCDHMALSKF